MDDLQSDILSADLRHRPIPVTTKDEDVPEDVKQLRSDIEKVERLANMNANDISRLTGHLIGSDGKGGALDRLEKGQESLMSAVNGINDSIKGLMSLHVNDIQQVSEKITENAHAIKETATITGSANDKIDDHLKDHKKKEVDAIYKKGARQWDLVKILSTGGVSLIAGVAITLVLVFIFGVGG